MTNITRAPTAPKIARPRNRLSNFAAAACAVMLLQASAIRAEQVELEEVAAFPTQQVTGVTVSAKGRVFVNFPFWSDDHTISVAEVVDGKPKPFPDEAWNAKAGPPAQRWICVQSVVVDDQDALWVLDPASPKIERGLASRAAAWLSADLVLLATSYSCAG
jgi:hypothetical protein